MGKELTYRKANKSDLDQLVDLTIESFNGANGRSFYESVFDIERPKYRELVIDIFKQEIPDNEYDIHAYHVLEAKGELVSCLAAWKEGDKGIDSERLLALMIIDLVGIDEWQKKVHLIEQAAEKNLARDQGKLQVENMFLKSAYRGTSAFFKIYYKTVDQIYKRYPECDTIQSRFFSSNPLAIRIAKHIGYTIAAESTFDIAPLNQYFPNEGMVMTELKKEDFYKKNKLKGRS